MASEGRVDTELCSELGSDVCSVGLELAVDFELDDVGTLYDAFVYFRG